MNTVIKTLFADSSGKELHEKLDTFWSEYTDFNHKNDNFDGNDLSGVVKISVMVIVICGIRNTLYHAPKSLVL